MEGSIMSEMTRRTFVGSTLAGAAAPALGIAALPQAAAADGVTTEKDVLFGKGGDIDLKLAPTSQGRLDFDSFSGSLDTNLPMTYRSGSKRHVQGDLGGGGKNNLQFKTFSGDVRLR